jgi:hypothetical protein
VAGGVSAGLTAPQPENSSSAAARREKTACLRMAGGSFRVRIGSVQGHSTGIFGKKQAILLRIPHSALDLAGKG